MKKFIIIFCITCISVNVIAQSGVRIGSYEIFIQKADNDSTIHFFVEDDPCPSCPPDDLPRPKPKPTFKSFKRSDSYFGVGFIIPDNADGYYTILGGNSLNLDFGNSRRYHVTRRFALGRSFQYSYYNYKLRINEPVYLEEVFKNRTFDKNDIAKQVYRSHNLALGAFARFYLIAPKKRDDGLYLDLGAQGDFAFSKYCKIKTPSGGKYKYRDGEAFNPFSASAVARIGWKGLWSYSNKQALFVRYRFTDAFNSKVLPMDLPPFTVGIQFF